LAIRKMPQIATSSGAQLRANYAAFTH
jgi:hypothetical protein